LGAHSFKDSLRKGRQKTKTNSLLTRGGGHGELKQGEKQVKRGM